MDEDEKPDNTVMYSPRHKTVGTSQVGEMSPKWYHMPEEEEKPEVKPPPADDPLQEYVEPADPEDIIKKEPKTEDGE